MDTDIKEVPMGTDCDSVCQDKPEESVKCKGCGDSWNTRDSGFVESFEIMQENDFKRCLNCVEECEEHDQQEYRADMMHDQQKEGE